MKKTENAENKTALFITKISYFYNQICNAVILSWFDWASIKLRFYKIFSNNFRLIAKRKSKLSLFEIILVNKAFINDLTIIKVTP